MRKSINSLTGLVEGSFFEVSPLQRIFVFCKRNRDQIELLDWDQAGFYLFFKGLRKGDFDGQTQWWKKHVPNHRRIVDTFRHFI